MSIFCVSLPQTQIYTKRRAKNIAENTFVSGEGGDVVLNTGGPDRGQFFTLYFTFLTETLRLSYTLYSQMVPLSRT